MQRAQRLCIVCALFALPACSSDPQPPLQEGDPPGFAPPPAPARGTQVLGLPFTVDAGAEAFMCVYLDQPLDRTYDVSRVETYQMPGGHHIIFSWVVDGYEPVSSVHPCDDSEMSQHRLIGVGGPNPAFAIEAPAGVAFEAPGNKRLVIQSHYVNTSTEPMVVRDAINLVEAEGPLHAHASQMVMVDMTFELPPQAPTVRKTTCNVTAESKVFALAGHTHQWGEHFSLELLRGGQSEMLYDVEAGEGFRDEPPLTTYPVDAPLELHPGDALRMTCEWFNDEPDAIRYPKEMCAAPMFYYPSRGFEICPNDGGEFVSIELD